MAIMFKNKYINNHTSLLAGESSGWLFIHSLNHLTLQCNIRERVVLSAVNEALSVVHTAAVVQDLFLLILLGPGKLPQ